ncbi:permease [Youhaiella tibetensis]|nr:DMT family transporter [Youhaiella tibetensis]GGF42725.1 permease [Youhaiella tibetensis]
MPSTASSPTAPSAPGIDYVGYALAIGGAVLFSTKGIFIKLAYQHGVPTETVLALRMLVALPVYAVILVTLLRRNPTLRQKLTPSLVISSMAVGMLGYYVSSYLDFAGLNFLSAQFERLVLFTYPFFTLMFGVWFFGDRMNWGVVPGMALSYLGLLVIFGWNLSTNPDGLWVGTGLVLASALTFAFYQHLAKRQMNHIGTGLFTCIAMGTAAIAAITQNTLWHGVASYGALSAPVWGYGLALGVLGTVVPSFLMNGGIARIGARATSSTGAFGPLFTIAIAVVVLNEPFTLYHAVGTACVILGSVWFGRADNRAKAKARTTQAAAAA